MVILSARKSFVKNCHNADEHLTWNCSVKLNEIPQVEALFFLEHELNEVSNLILLNTTLFGSHIETFWLANHSFLLLRRMWLLDVYFVNIC